MSLRVETCHPMLYMDINIWTIVRNPYTQQVHLLKTPCATRLAAALTEDGDPIHKKLKSLFGADVEIVDRGDWNNVADRDKLVNHPFTGQRVKRDSIRVTKMPPRWIIRLMKAYYNLTHRSAA